MSTKNQVNNYDDEEHSEDTAPSVPEASPSTKLERRRRIEDLFEEKRLKEELAEFG